MPTDNALELLDDAHSTIMRLAHGAERLALANGDGTARQVSDAYKRTASILTGELRPTVDRLVREREASRRALARMSDLLVEVAAAHEREVAAVWRALGEPHELPEPQEDIATVVKSIARLTRERDAAVTTVAGRTVPPTPAEAAAHKAAGGEWLLVMAPTITTLPTEVVVDPPTRPLAYVTLHVPLDRLRRPCAWPVVAE